MSFSERASRIFHHSLQFPQPSVETSQRNLLSFSINVKILNPAAALVISALLRAVLTVFEVLAP